MATVICYLLFGVQVYLMVLVFRKVFLEYIFNKKTYEPDSEDCVIWEMRPEPQEHPAYNRKAS